MLWEQTGPLKVIKFDRWYYLRFPSMLLMLFYLYSSGLVFTSLLLDKFSPHHMTSMVNCICLHIVSLDSIGTTWKTHLSIWKSRISCKYVKNFVSFSSLTKKIISLTQIQLPLSSSWNALGYPKRPTVHSRRFRRSPRPILWARQSCYRPRFLDCLRLGMGRGFGRR